MKEQIKYMRKEQDVKENRQIFKRTSNSNRDLKMKSLNKPTKTSMGKRTPLPGKEETISDFKGTSEKATQNTAQRKKEMETNKES